MGYLSSLGRSSAAELYEARGRYNHAIAHYLAARDYAKVARVVMGRFIGTDGQRLLELQSIAEQFAARGRGKLWLIVTAQARLHEIIAGVKALEADFGEIGDRFDTRPVLTPEDVEKMLEGRILIEERGPRAGDTGLLPRPRGGAGRALHVARRQPRSAGHDRRTLRR